ncbi:Hsp20/alpha crystallin family protein [Streptomyces sp. NPDC001107]
MGGLGGRHGLRGGHCRNRCSPPLYATLRGCRSRTGEKDDIAIELNAGELSVHGEITEKERTGVLRHRTRRTGQFDYRVPLPQDTDEEPVSAELADGVLTAKVPKSEKAKPRRIEIAG